MRPLIVTTVLAFALTTGCTGSDEPAPQGRGGTSAPPATAAPRDTVQPPTGDATDDRRRRQLCDRIVDVWGTFGDNIDDAVDDPTGPALQTLRDQITDTFRDAPSDMDQIVATAAGWADWIGDYIEVERAFAGHVDLDPQAAEQITGQMADVVDAIADILDRCDIDEAAGTG